MYVLIISYGFLYKKVVALYDSLDIQKPHFCLGTVLTKVRKNCVDVSAFIYKVFSSTSLRDAAVA